MALLSFPTTVFELLTICLMHHLAAHHLCYFKSQVQKCHFSADDVTMQWRLFVWRMNPLWQLTLGLLCSVRSDRSSLLCYGPLIYVQKLQSFLPQAPNQNQLRKTNLFPSLHLISASAILALALFSIISSPCWLVKSTTFTQRCNETI